MFANRIKAGMLLSLAMALLLGACRPATPQEPTLEPNAIYTAAAQTVEAQLTKAALLTPSATVTPTKQPTNTPQPTTSLPAVTLAPTGALAVTKPATVPQSSSPDKALWISQTPEDKITLNPGQSFDLVWKIKNTGTTTWTTDYLYRYFAGEKLAASTAYNLPNAVKPDEEVAITLKATAPNRAGDFLSTWVITNAGGINFYTVYFQFKVAGDPVASVTTTSSAPEATATIEVAATETPTETNTP